MTHGYAAQARTYEIHQAMINRDYLDGRGTCGEELVILLDRGNDGIAQGQRHLGQPEHQDAGH
jgi:hypothetical protein